MNKLTNIAAALIFSMPLLSLAQNAPQAGGIVATAPGQAAVAEAVQLQGKVKSIDKKTRTVVVGAEGNEVSIAAGKDARNFKQIQIGDLVTLTYVQALVLELKKVDNKAVSERIESEKAVRSKLGEKPGGAIERSVRVIADVIAVNPDRKTVTLRGPQRTVDLAVNDPAQLNAIKVGNQVEAVFTETVILEVTAAQSPK